MPNLIYILLFVLVPLFFIKKPVWALTSLIILGINIYGIVPTTEFPFISAGNFGRLFAHDILLLFLLGIMFLRSMNVRKIGIRRISSRLSINQPLIALLLLTVLEGVLSFVRGGDPHFIVQNMRPFAYYLTYFLISLLLKSEDELRQFVKLFVLIAIITAGVIYYQALTGELNRAVKIDYLSEFGIYQTLNVGINVIVCTFLGFFSLVIGKKINIKYLLPTRLILFWLGGAIFLLLARGIWISILLAMGIIIILNFSKITKSITLLFLILVFFVVAFPVLQERLGSESLSYILKTRISTVEDSFVGRTSFMKVRLNYLINNPSLFGHGFELGFDPSDPTIVTGHNLIGDLAARFGFSGFFIFGWLFITVLRKAMRLFKALPNSWQKSVVCGLLAYNLQEIILSYSSNSYFQIWGILPVASSWAVLELIERFHKQKQMKNLSDKIA